MFFASTSTHIKKKRFFPRHTARQQLAGHNSGRVFFITSDSAFYLCLCIRAKYTLRARVCKRLWTHSTVNLAVRTSGADVWHHFLVPESRHEFWTLSCHIFEFHEGAVTSKHTVLTKVSPSEVTSVARQYRSSIVMTKAACDSMHEPQEVRQTRCVGGEDPPEDTPCRYKGQHVDGCCVRGLTQSTVLLPHSCRFNGIEFDGNSVWEGGHIRYWRCRFRLDRQ